MSVANNLTGKTLSNRYEILRPLGEGGMGKVYLAKDKRFGKQVVVKMPTMDAGDKNFKDRFMREIASLATLEHPHIVTTVDWGEIEGIPFLVLRYLGGGSLRDRITDAEGYYKPMPLEGLNQWLPQIASALDFIHTKNWVHRDLKPDNILFDEAGNPYLADFGIAKALEGAPMGVKTIMGAFIGTPQYMAPEMHLGKGIGPRADQFGLAVLVYESLAGKIPFNGITPTAIFVEVIQGKARPIHELVAGIPLEKSNALMKGITKEPRDRYGSCVEFANAVTGSMLARGSRLVSNEIPSKPEIAGTRIETPLPIPLAIPVSMPLEITGIRIETPSKPEIASTRIETPLPVPQAIPVSMPLEITGTRIETPSKPEAAGTRIETPPPIPLEITDSIPLEILGTRIETPSNPEIVGTRIETPPPIPLEITDSIIEEVPEQLNNAEEAETQSSQSDPEEFNYDSNLYSDLALTTEDYLTENGQMLAQLCRDLIEKEKVSKGWWIKASRFFKKHDVSQILGGKALLEKMEEINKLGRVSREISDNVVQLAIRILKEKKPLVENEIENLINNELAEEQILGKVVKNPTSKIVLNPPISLGQSSAIVFVILMSLLFLIFGRDFNWQQGEGKEAADDLEKGTGELENFSPYYLRKEVAENIGKGIKLNLILIPAGKFMMGSPASENGRADFEEGQQEETLTNPFYMGKYEVTQEQWEAVMGSGFLWFGGNPSYNKGQTLPVTNVSWEDCQDFIKKLNAQTKGGYRLPTEAEWEYACRAGTTTAYSYGENLTKSDANIDSSSIKALGSYKPNAFGLYDMHGNVWEWCKVKLASFQEGSVIDPKGPATGEYHVLRGGSYGFHGSFARCSSRIGLTQQSFRDNDIGFRLARTINPADLKKVELTEKQMELDKLNREKEAKAKQDELAKFVTIEKEMIFIPAGTFLMGSSIAEVDRKDNETQHTVNIRNSFYMSKYEVTQEHWKMAMGNNPSFTKSEKLPVTDVSWEDCQEFIKKLNTKTNGGYRLPTEAEWEYACRAETSTAYSFGESITKSDANYGDGASGKPKEIGSYKPNAFGLCDMHGNVWEWCEDRKSDYPEGEVTDPRGPATGEYRVLRGGSFSRSEVSVRSAARYFGSNSSYRDSDLGFRLVRTMNSDDLLKPDIKAFLLKAKQEEEEKAKQMELVKLKQEELKFATIEKELVLIPAGKFMMGNPGKANEVTLTKPFYLSKYEVTQGQWEGLMGGNPSSRTKGATLPVTDISWEDCQDFIKKLNAKTNGGYRLPTDAEWEYTCRAGTTTAYSYGESLTKSDANFDGDSIKAVGSYSPNAFGLYDMHGNVWEWCEDWKADYPAVVVTDPKGPAAGERRVLRGGSFFSNVSEARSSFRSFITPTTRYIAFGFRLARNADLKAEIAPTVPKSDPAEVMSATGNILIVPFTEVKAKEVQKEVAKSLKKEVEEKADLGKGVNLEMVLVPAGKFMMGSPASENGRSTNEKQHEVTITKPYYMGKYEVTQEQWEAVMGDNPSKIKGKKLPVTEVSWLDCQEFIKKLNAKTNGSYRLPTEAEWEYACRAGTSTAYSYGDSLKKSDANTDSGSIMAAGSYKPNAFGLHDMHGNVWEWCEDWKANYPAEFVKDPKGPATGEYRVLRGGAFLSNVSAARSSYRDRTISPTNRDDTFGFRLAKTP